jgi:uncharacterized protein (TIGR03435 family)
MRNVLPLVLTAASLLSAQPAWKEFSIGAPTVGRNQSGPFGIRASSMPLLRAISKAYGIPEHRIVGPSWLAAEKYAIIGVVDEPKDFQPLFQQELAQRFQMIAHREQKVVPVFILKPIESSIGGSAKLPSTPADGSSSLSGGPSPALQMTGATMDAFAAALSDAIHRPVWNETGIDGAFQIRLSWEFGNLKSLATAVKEQLGLQLIDDNRPVDLLVIDHIEKLSFK